MASITSINVADGDPVKALQGFMASLLEEDVVDAVFTLWERPGAGEIMPALITDPKMTEQAVPLSPAYPLNGARLLARLTHGESRGRVAAFLRPCELRAFVELIKLNQAGTQDLIMVGVDCFGAYDNRTYRELAKGNDHKDLANEFVLAGGKVSGAEVARACKACEYPVAGSADLAVGLVGVDVGSTILLAAQSAAGESVINRLGLQDASGGPEREQAVEALVKEREAYRDAMFEETAAATADLKNLSAYLAGCVNCYNCRVACPVCYCKECVFVTDVFDHKPWQYMGWAHKDGSLRMPTDTIFFHLTRMAHMSTACVGCGQCSNACPNDIPVMELFRLVSQRTQGAFDYEPGLDMNEPPPLNVFKEDEFTELTCAT
ncbi:4Fe-4S binding protein [Pseudodesulfovibrio senegalensis]|jgi:formate dehydrogenase subunit beta|uniref:Formate dehydrogenase n=1 Tax=Pseudodesulfovibrio senegalensis TaxID=1721087 RepID=A0A6N6N646_9BACT|nr:4Fe-4S binding protein [Pseudodesulfovibrio senegalensis]KAB1443211.1 formate dehydrogenase [Pseudodesulfovibrio senegalensis]